MISILSHIFRMHIVKNLFQKISLFIYAQVWPWQWSWIVCIANVHFASYFRTDMQGVDIFSLGSMLNMLPCQDGWQTRHLKPLCTTLCILQLLNGEDQPALAIRWNLISFRRLIAIAIIKDLITCGDQTRFWTGSWCRLGSIPSDKLRLRHPVPRRRQGRTGRSWNAC